MPAFPGFDTGDYPGDDLVTRWAGDGSPYQFIGYYLEAPCHGTKFTPFTGKFGLLKSLGWGLVIVYVGRQVNGCGSGSLNAATGDADGKDAIAKGTAEGFPPGAVIYLDVEPFDGGVPAGMKDYVSAWLDTLLADGTFAPGIYCHSKNANDLHAIGQERFAAASSPFAAPSFWITHPESAFDVGTSAPADSGVPFADVWQGQIDVSGVEHAGVTLASADLNVANSQNPSKA